METTNLKSIEKKKKFNLLINIGSFSLIVIVGMIDFFRDYRIIAIVSLAILFILVLLFITMLKYSYIYFNNSGNKITVRYYPIRIIARKYMAIEIPKDKFIGYKIQKAFFGFREELILVQDVKNKRIEYPPISLTALNNIEREKILKTLKTKLS